MTRERALEFIYISTLFSLTSEYWLFTKTFINLPERKNFDSINSFNDTVTIEIV